MPDILSNPHCRYRIWRLHEPMPFLVRNADGDELLFIHEGAESSTATTDTSS
jgi:homogentisate 1,2-dioxygenase